LKKRKFLNSIGVCHVINKSKRKITKVYQNLDLCVNFQGMNSISSTVEIARLILNAEVTEICQKFPT